MKIEHENPVQGNVRFHTVYISATVFHWHEHCELIVVLENPMDFYVEGVVEHLCPGDVVFIPPCMLHCAIPLAGELSRVGVFSFPQTYLAMSSGTGAFWDSAAVDNPKGYLLRNRGEHSDSVRQAAEYLLNRYKETEFQDCLTTRGFVFYTLGLLQENGVRLEEGEPASADGKPYEKIFPVCSYIEEHIYEKISIGELAQMTNYSVSHFSRLFRENVGYSVKEYIDIMKIREGRRLLQLGEKSVTETAYLLGFSHPNNFGRVYKRVTGRNPREDRRK